MSEPADSHMPLGREPGPQSLRAAADGDADGDGEAAGGPVRRRIEVGPPRIAVA